MSEMQEFSAMQKNESGVNPAEEAATLPESTHSLKEIRESLDGQTYFMGEVPQEFSYDPHAFLPLNSDRLIGAENIIEKTLRELDILVEHEISHIQKTQTRIALCEERIEKNKGQIQKNAAKIKQNNADILMDKRNRDYWLSRAEEIRHDYMNAEAADRKEKWSWLIKKWGLKLSDGSPIPEIYPSVEELCNGEVQNFAGEYQTRGNLYEQQKKDREAEITRLWHDNARLESSTETLMKYVSSAYTNEIEPIQDGVLLLKELGLKLKALGANGQDATFGDLRGWAESFLNEFLLSNPRVASSVVSDFRRLASIPLPPEHS